MICLTHRTDYIPDAINRHFVISFFFFFLAGGGAGAISCIKCSLCHSKYTLYGYTGAA